MGSAARRSASVKRAEMEALLDQDSESKPINFDEREPEEDGERIVVFHLNGKDYSVPKKPRMNLGLKFSLERKKFGSAVAVASLLEDMLGEEGFEALMNFDGMTAEDLEVITEICSRAAMGKLEAQKAK